MVFNKDDIIQFNWQNNGYWYDDYKIETINQDGTYNVRYLSGNSIDENVPESLLRGFEAKCIAEIESLEIEKVKLDTKINLARAKLELFHSETAVGKESPRTINALEAVLEPTLILQSELPCDSAEGTARTEILNMANRLLSERLKTSQDMLNESIKKAQSLFEQAANLYHSSFEGNPLACFCCFVYHY
jgi:hypothetical protein